MSNSELAKAIKQLETQVEVRDKMIENFKNSLDDKDEIIQALNDKSRNHASDLQESRNTISLLNDDIEHLKVQLEEVKSDLNHSKNKEKMLKLELLNDIMKKPEIPNYCESELVPEL